MKNRYLSVAGRLILWFASRQGSSDAQRNQDAQIKDVTDVALVKCLASTVDVEGTPDISIKIGREFDIR
jgi:hypothetical protein